MSRPAAQRVWLGAVIYVWAGLVLATLVSCWLGSERSAGLSPLRSCLVLAVAFIKSRFVGLYFMDLRDAPVLARAFFEIWCLAVLLVLTAMYLLV